MSPCAGVRVAQASCPKSAPIRPEHSLGTPPSPALRILGPSGDPMASSAPSSDTRARIFGRACHSWERSRERVSLLTAKTLRTPPTQHRGHDTRVTSGTRVTRGRGANCLRMEPGARARSRLPAHGYGCPRMDRGCAKKPQAGRGIPVPRSRLTVARLLPCTRPPPALH